MTLHIEPIIGRYAHIEIEALPIEQAKPDAAATNEEPEAHSD